MVQIHNLLNKQKTQHHQIQTKRPKIRIKLKHKYNHKMFKKHNNKILCSKYLKM